MMRGGVRACIVIPYVATSRTVIASPSSVRPAIAISMRRLRK